MNDNKKELVMNDNKKEIVNPNRDLGDNNSVRREHLDIWKLDLPSYVTAEYDTVTLLQRIVNKIEHKFEHCEKFISDNQDNIKLSYYTDGYYNGRARAFEDVIDTIKEIIEKVAKEEYDR